MMMMMIKCCASLSGVSEKGGIRMTFWCRFTVKVSKTDPADHSGVKMYA
uniref:Uncharacterized protein n=1 Tax=Anguilla anguilla TaxID=7936 RepID=A0A0E9RWZ1_ANGAN